MQKSSVAKRYAKAAFELALENNDIDGWLNELKAAAETMQEPQVAQVLQSVKVHRAEKRQLMMRLLPDQRPLVVNLVSLLIAKERTDIMGGIVEEYQQLVNAQRGVAVAEVVTAVPVDDGEKVLLADRLSKITGKRIVLQTRVDPEILGGLVARIGDKVLDGSLRTRLVLLRRSLLGATR